MKITLISLQNSEVVREEIGLGIITSFLRQAGHEVLLTRVNPENIDLDEIVEFNPEIVGFTAYRKDKNSLIKVSKKLRELLKESYICAGGLLPSYYPEELLNETNDIDFVVIGEGEITMLNVVKSIENKEEFTNIKGIAFKHNNKVVVNSQQEPIKDMDILPFQSRDLLLKHNIKYAYLSGSRGCKKQCTFCNSRSFWNGWKGKTISKLVDEVEYIVNEFNIHTFKILDGSFEDSNIYSKNERVMAFANEVLKRKLDISYHINLRAESYKLFTEDDIQTLKKSGLICVFIGIESGNQEDLSLYGKSARLVDCSNALSFFKKHDIYVEIGFINFNPYSTIDRLSQNVDFLEKNNRASILYYLTIRLEVYEGSFLCKRILRDKLNIDCNYYEDENHRYIDRNIQKFGEFVNNYYNELRSKLNLDIITYFGIGYNSRIENLKRRTKKESTINVIKAIDTNVQNIMSNINTLNAQWFRKLIELAKDWNEQEVIDITNKYHDVDSINECIAQLKNYNVKLYKELLKNDSEMLFVYENFL